MKRWNRLAMSAAFAAVSLLGATEAFADGGYYGRPVPPPPPIRVPVPRGPSYNPYPPAPVYRVPPPPVRIPPPPVRMPIVAPPPPVIVPPPAPVQLSQSDDDDQAAQMISTAFAGGGCAQAGAALRRLSNAILGEVNFATTPNPFPPASDDLRGRLREEMRHKWMARFRSAQFWQAVWDRLAERYRTCNIQCFDDGTAIGQISGAGYCAASVAVGGLGAPGFQAQAPLPLCQNATFVGCQQGYRSAAASFQGCANYTQDGFTDVFNQFVSEDCHMDQ
ncbi:MAG: hypothetical protein ACXWP5_05630 [Bdellovibrionota bacterium]